MDRLRSPSRRVLAFVAGALLGLVGAVAIASPATATAQTEVSGSCVWDLDTSEWVVSWTVNGDTPAQLTEVAVTPEDSQLDGIQPDSSFGAGEPLVGEQRVPEGASSASLSVQAQSDDGQLDGQGEIQIPADCEVPEGPELTDELGQWAVSCDALTITVANSTAEELALTFAPSTGDPVDVEVAGDESATVQFPPAEGLTVDVLVNGEPAELDEPIAITPDVLADLDCDEEEGEGGGLPATGTSVALFAGGAVVLLALGAGLYLLARHRRVTFTA